MVSLVPTTSKYFKILLPNDSLANINDLISLYKWAPKLFNILDNLLVVISSGLILLININKLLLT